ncbi:DNA polymerase III subunit beta [bacterium]|jgi:DNA polymerase III subunit beta|nr:DNA polymerase III subunit beta [bacterium]MBT6832302.1 DNA polymerase III subunit beta [bacterium]MBT6996029.1 DNA polymerase III subunit beta [bacterium]MBT7772318.1 DNA polymerase III subunit beta [bacterium]
MKVVIPQDSLLESLKIVSRAVSGANTLPVLGNILIRAENKKVHFSATNLELSITTSCEATVKNEGALTVPAKILTAYSSLLGKEEDVELVVSDGATLEIKTKSSKTKMKGISADEFPAIATVASGTKLELDAKDFRSAVHRVAFAAQENSSRPILAGVFFSAEKNELRMAATDSYRLSEKLLKLSTAVEKTTCVIPVRSVFEADRLSGSESGVSITVGENQVMFSFGATQLTSRLIDGQFPDYAQIIPKNSTTVAEVPRAEFELAVRRVSIFAKQNNQHMKLEFLGDGTLTISTDATEIGEEKTTLSVKVEGSSNVIALNADYVLDVLGALADEENIKIELDGKMAPAVVKSMKNGGFIHLIMPLKM